MRRLALAAITAVVLGGLTIAVNASPTDQRKRATSEEGASTPEFAKQVARVADATKLAKISPPKCNVNQEVTKYVKCINKYLIKLANGVEDALDAISQLVAADCLVAVPVTQYGDSATQLFGYVWNPGGGAPTFLTSALDYTEDPTTTDFNWFVLANPECVS